MRTLSAFAVLLLVTACQAPPAEMTEAEKAEVRAEVEAYLSEYGEAWNTGDLDWAMSLHSQTPEFAWAMDGMITRGFDRFDEGVRAFYTTSVGTRVWTGTDRHISILSRDLAVVLDAGTVVNTDVEGVTAESTCTYTYVLVRQDGEWKLLLGQGAFVTN